MAKLTHLDSIVEFKDTVIQKLATSQEVIGLILDKPDIDVNSEDAEAVYKHLYSYDYLDDTVSTDSADIAIDVDLYEKPTGTEAKYYLYVQIICNKGYMGIKNFKGLKGNRRDNLARFVDKMLNGSRDFGIGRLDLVRAETTNVPYRFTCKTLTYEIHGFAQNRELLNG